MMAYKDDSKVLKAGKDSPVRMTGVIMEEIAQPIFEYVCHQIEKGVLKPGDRLGTAKELAKKWDTSFGNVRQSLEKLAEKGIVVRKPRAGTFISDEPLISIQEDLGCGKYFSLLVPDITQPEHSFLTRYIQDAAHDKNLDMVVNSTNNEQERYDQIIRRQIKAGVLGLVLVSPNHQRISFDVLGELRESGIPVVNCGNILEAVSWPTVMTDVFHGAYIVGKHLCQLGRKHIALISYEEDDYWHAQRLCGFYKSMLDVSGERRNVSEVTVPLGLYSADCGWRGNDQLRELLMDWLDQNPGVDAAWCAHDQIAAMLLRVLKERNLRAPQDIAVAGSSHMIQYFGLVPGELTTLDTCFAKKAAVILDLLLAMSNGEEVEPHLKIAISPELVIGKSTVGDISR